MKRFAVIIALLLSHFASAEEWNIAVINDADGFTFVRSGGGKAFMVIDTIRKDAFFYCIGDTTLQWISVQHAVNGKMGYMHHSRISFFHRLDSARQHQLILNAFQETKRINENYWSRLKQSTKEQAAVLKKKRYDNFEGTYIPAYTVFTKLFCKQPDSILLVAFFKTLRPLSGSADEGKDWATAKCWLCHPEFVENIVCHWKDEDERLRIISSIETGMAMSSYEAQFTPAQLKKKYASLEKKCVD